MIKVALAGGRGYVGEELLGLLTDLPDYEVVYVGSRSSAGKPVSAEYKDLSLDLTFQDLSAESIAECDADVWILAQPNNQASSFVGTISQSNPDAKIIDISSDFRFDDTWVYGLPEKNAEAIAQATRVANPGCYATATQLALLPLLDQIVNPPVAFGISGFSGAGRTPGEKNDPDRLVNNILPYSLTDHTHEREVSYQLEHDIRFMPHVASFFRGISMTVHANLSEATDPAQMHERFRKFYGRCSLVNVVKSIPEIQHVAKTNQAIVGGFAVDPRDPRNVVIISVIDNLRKGAASQAIQNLNLMSGLASEKGLIG